MDRIEFRGEVLAVCRHADGSLAWSEFVRNDITLAGLTDLLSAAFAAGTQRTAWYLGLIDSTGYTGIDEDDTMSSHAGWSEATGYSSATRPQWSSLVASGGVILNTAPASFVITSNTTIKGIFLASNNTKSGTTGILWNRGIFSVARSLVAGQTLTVTYTVRAAGGTS